MLTPVLIKQYFKIRKCIKIINHTWSLIKKKIQESTSMTVSSAIWNLISLFRNTLVKPVG